MSSIEKKLDTPTFPQVPHETPLASVSSTSADRVGQAAQVSLHQASRLELPNGGFSAEVLAENSLIFLEGGGFQVHVGENERAPPMPLIPSGLTIPFQTRVNENFQTKALLTLLDPKGFLVSPIPSPYSTMAHYYASAQNPEQKKACLSYLLHYQHYNAEFTKEECKQLGYSLPLCSVHKDSGYTRTDSKRLFGVARAWIRAYVLSFIINSHCYPGFAKEIKSKRGSFIKLTTSSVEAVLRGFYQGSIANIENVRNIPQLCPKAALIIPLEIKDLQPEKTALRILEERLRRIYPWDPLGTLKKNCSNLHFIFLLQNPMADCTIMWTAKWDAQNLSLLCIPVKEVLGGELLSLLNKTGAVPDRIAVNQLITHKVENETFEQAVKKLVGPATFTKEEVLPKVSTLSTHWDLQMREIEQYRFEEDPGSELLRDAIFRWNECFFKPYGLLPTVSSLLCSEVCPWMALDGGVVKWAKAYQNLCEIVFFCLQYFSTSFKSIKFEESFLKLLGDKKQFSGIYRSIGLFPYAMSTLFHIFQHIFKRDEVFRGRKANVACISQNYFETLMLVEKMSNQVQRICPDANSLSQITEVPDILIADIHPNNAASALLFQNNVAPWVKNLLENPGKCLILILDVTLNHLSDSTIQETFGELTEFIKEGRLEIFGLQSLAKLFQLGADNFSGGLCLYLGKEGGNAKPPVFPEGIWEKKTFFALMANHFNDINKRYILQVRQNTEWMRQTLVDRFTEISKVVQIDQKEVQIESKDHKDCSINFCVGKVTQNTDENTVYVAINFSPLLNIIEFDELNNISRLICSLLENLNEKDNINKNELIEKLLQHLEIEDGEKNKFVSSLLEILNVETEKFEEKLIAFIIKAVKHQEEKRQEKIVNQLRKMILAMAKERHLPLTGRQSFGFSLSNMSGTPSSIRFSIGIESPEILQQYADLISDFIHALSCYAAENPNLFKIATFEGGLKAFEERITTANLIVNGNLSLVPRKVFIQQEDCDEDGIDIFNPAGEANVGFTNRQLSLKILDRIIPFKEIKRGIDCAFSVDGWSSSDVFQLIFHLIALNAEPVYVMRENKSYVIYGVFKHHYTFSDKSKITDKYSRATVRFYPSFSVTPANAAPFGLDKVFIDPSKIGVPQLDTGLIRISKLNDIYRDLVFNHCVHTHFSTEDYKEGSILLRFQDRRDHEDYSQKIEHLMSEGELEGIVNYLNIELNYKDLPLIEGEVWWFQRNPKEHLLNALNSLGSLLVYTLSDTVMGQIEQIRDEQCARALKSGMVDGLIRGSMDSNKQLSLHTAEYIAEVFSTDGFGDISYYLVSQWIEEFEKFIKQNLTEFERVESFLFALLPLIKRFYGNVWDLSIEKYSIPLRNIGEITSFKPLQEHLLELERSFPDWILTIEQSASITALLRFFLRYHPSDESIKLGLLAHLKQISPKLRTEWLCSQPFYYRPLDRFWIGMHATPDEDLICDKKEQANLKVFFDALEGGTLLAEENDDVASRWKSITQS